MAGAPRADVAAALRRRAPHAPPRARAATNAGARSGSTTPPARSRGRPGCASTPAARRRGSPPTRPRGCSPAPAGSWSTARGDLRIAGAPAFDVVVEHPLERRAGRDAARRRRRGRDVGAGAPRLARPRRRRRAPPARSRDGRAGLDRPRLRHRAAPTALEAETLAKTALLRGPAGARRVLGRRGGVLIHDDGTVERVGAAARPRVRLRRADLRPAPITPPALGAAA